MKKKLLFIILGLVLSNITIGQTLDRLISFCNLKDYTHLYKMIDSLRESRVRAGVEIDREIVDNYYETIFYYEEFFKIKENPNVYDVYPYEIKLLSKFGKIIYCNFICNRNKNNPDTLVYYTDSVEFQKMKIKYNEIYNYSIEISQFFDKSVVYGHNCGIVGTQPEPREKIEEFIRTNDIAKINEWLQSPTVELQVYACEALFRMKENGFSLGKEQMRMIMEIINKNGEIRVCGGCIYSNEKISYACKDFKF